MHDCLHNHQCRVPSRSAIGDDSPLPTRIIDVGSSDGVPCLLETHGRRGKYFTLSHCWGRQHLITTTTQNLEERKKGIPWPELSKTFQEAIQITREFGCQYLWIDSLCILQDSVQDWEISNRPAWLLSTEIVSCPFQQQMQQMVLKGASYQKSLFVEMSLVF